MPFLNDLIYNMNHVKINPTLTRHSTEKSYTTVEDEGGGEDKYKNK